MSPAVKSPAPEDDVQNLVDRMRRRQYPETIDVLASYWLKALYSRGCDHSWWKRLHARIIDALDREVLTVPAQEALAELRDWIRIHVLSESKIAAPVYRKSPARSGLALEALSPYLRRLLNEWLAGEIANALVEEKTEEDPTGPGIPPLTVARCIERLLVRENLSASTLEMLLDPRLLSPRYLYPRDAEILNDVVLGLLGWTSAPGLPCFPAILVAESGQESGIDLDHAVLSVALEKEEIRVPVAPERASSILANGEVHIASALVTMDGRCWRSESLERGEQYSVVYRPAGLLRIDYSADHARVAVPWPENPIAWSGQVHLRGPFELFGREWMAESWESGTDGARLNLVFSRVIPISAADSQSTAALHRSHPASIDIAWSALEDAVAVAVSSGSREPVEQLRRAEFVPLGRAIYGLAEAVSGRKPDRSAIVTQLRGIQYLQASIALEYGQPPWRVLPASVQAYLLKTKDPALRQLASEAFESAPGRPDGPNTHSDSRRAA